MSKASDLANLIGNINAGGGGVNRNVLINGAMNVAQRGTSATGIGADADTNKFPTMDRWNTFHGGTTAGRLTMTQDSSAPSGFANSMKLDCTTADTSIAAGEEFLISQKIEGQNLQTVAKGTADAKPLVLSWYAKGTAKTYGIEIYDNDNTRHFSANWTVTSDWQRFTQTIPADTTGTFDDDNALSLYVLFWIHAGTTYSSGSSASSWAAVSNANRAAGVGSFFSSTDNELYITGVQLEVGQNATEFEHEPYERTLAKCQRYFQQWTQEASGFATNNYAAVADSVMHADNYAFMQYHHPVDLRATPALTFNGSFASNNSGADRALSSMAINTKTPHVTSFYGTIPDNNEAGQVGFMRAANDGDASIFFDSEL